MREVTSLPDESQEPAASAPLVALPDLAAPAGAPAPPAGQHDGDAAAENEVLRRAIATTAHEIRNPVTVLMGIAESIQASAESMDTERLARLLRTLERQTQLLDRITADLLVSAQARTAPSASQRRLVRPGPVIEAVLAHRDRVRVLVEDERPVLVDPDRLRADAREPA